MTVTDNSFPYKIVNNRIVGLPKQIRPRSKRFLRTKCPIDWWSKLSTYQHQGGALADEDVLACYFYEMGQENAFGPVEKPEQNESVKEDRATLKRIVESYGKNDVIKFVTESLDESPVKKAAIMKAYNELEYTVDDDSPDETLRILEALYDTAADEGYQLGHDEGYKEGYSDCEDEYEDQR